MPLNPAPIQAPIAGADGRVAQVWVRWFAAVLAQIGSGGGGGGSASWGGISGTLSAQTDLQNALNNKAALVHTHTASQITDLSDNLRVFIQDTTPVASGPYLWIDTTGGDLQFNVEDGL